MTGRLGAPLILVPLELLRAVQGWNASWGWLRTRNEDAENMFVVDGAGHDDLLIRYPGLSERGHFTASRERVRNGHWYRVQDLAHELWAWSLRRGVEVSTDHLASLVTQSWQAPPADNYRLVLACSGVGDDLAWSGWWVSREWSHPAEIAVVTNDRNDLRFLNDVWPVERLAAVTATIVGVGSIGGSAAEALSTAGIGELILVDPDRLFEHNLPRHRLTERDLGRFKVNAMRDVLRARRPRRVVTALPYSVCDDADLLRPIFAKSEIIVCAADGVESRRVTNHLARRANTPLVLAAVFDDGAYGELIRVRPRTGCLLCQRHSLREQGIFDPEPSIDGGYSTGTRERPMTAAPGDLRLMGELAAKAAVATVLQRAGRRDQRLPGDWALIALQPKTGAAAPFDGDCAGLMTWHDMPDRWDDCPTCAPA